MLKYINDANAQAQRETMNTLASAVRQISVTAHMCTLDNSDPKRTRSWLRDAEKWRLINNTTDKEAVTALLSRGKFSDLIQRCLNKTIEAQPTWLIRHF